MVLVGKITLIEERPGTGLVYGRVKDLREERSYPFQAPSGMFNVGDKVSFEPEEYDEDTYRLVKGKQRVVLKEEL